MKFLRLLLMGYICILLTACGVPQIYDIQSAKEDAVSVSAHAIRENIVYVKDGTIFTPVYAVNTSSTGATNEPLPATRFIWMNERDDVSVPVLYYGETLCLYSTTGTIEKLTAERYKDCGWSFGLCRLTDAGDGLLIDTNSSALTGTTLEPAMKNYKDSKVKSLQIISVSGEPLSEFRVSLPGTIMGLQQGQQYDVTLRVGTTLSETKWTADTHMLESSELIPLKGPQSTALGYDIYTMPDGTKSGYYYLPGYGLFRYIAERKAAAYEDLSMYGMNEANMVVGNVLADDDFLISDTQYRGFTLDKYADYCQVTYTASTSSYVTKALLKDPEGKEHPMKDGRWYLKKAPAGAYSVVFYGYNITDISVEHYETALPTPTPSPEPSKAPAPTAAPVYDPDKDTVQPQGTDESPAQGTDSPVYEYIEVPETEPLVGPEVSDTLPG